MPTKDSTGGGSGDSATEEVPRATIVVTLLSSKGRTRLSSISDAMPVAKELVGRVLQTLPDDLRPLSRLCDLSEVSNQVRPAQLALFDIDPVVPRPAIGDQRSIEPLAQQLLGNRAAAAGPDQKHRGLPVQSDPEPGLLVRFPPARLVGVHGPLAPDVLERLLVGVLQSLARLPLQVRDRPQRHRYSEEVRHELLHVAPRHAVCTREHCYRRLQSRAEGTRGGAFGQLRTCRFPAGRTGLRGPPVREEQIRSGRFTDQVRTAAGSRESAPGLPWVGWPRPSAPERVRGLGKRSPASNCWEKCWGLAVLSRGR